MTGAYDICGEKVKKRPGPKLVEKRIGVEMCPDCFDEDVDTRARRERDRIAPGGGGRSNPMAALSALGSGSWSRRRAAGQRSGGSLHG